MPESSNPLVELFQLALVDPETREILAQESESCWRLPTIAIPRWSRVARQAQIVIESQLGYRAVLIDLLESKENGAKLIIAEKRRRSDSVSVSSAHRWVDFETLNASAISDEHSSVLIRLTQEGTTGRGALSRIGWVDEILKWVSDQLGTAPEDFSDDIEQFKAYRSSLLAQFRRVRGSPALWIKAEQHGSDRECEITDFLATRSQSFLPKLIGVRQEWRAWCMEDAGKSLDQCHSQRILCQASRRLAEFQIETISMSSSLFSVGCTDLRSARLLHLIPELIDWFVLAMESPPSIGVRPLTRSRLHQLGLVLAEACLRLEDLCIPDTLLHGDICFENILTGVAGCVFIDWENAGIGNPFLTFAQLRAQASQESLARRWLQEMEREYIRAWCNILSEGQILGAMNLVPPLASALHVLNGSNFLPPGKHLGYLRSMAREIDQSCANLSIATPLWPGASFASARVP